MKRFVCTLAVTLCAACGAALPTAPTRAPIPVGYDINVPSITDVQAFAPAWPHGVLLSPVEAQRRYDFTLAYGGTPNVYVGSVLPPCNPYQGVGIVIAPYSAASVPTFQAAQWPTLFTDVTETYQWVGRFVVARVATPQEITPCHAQ